MTPTPALAAAVAAGAMTAAGVVYHLLAAWCARGALRGGAPAEREPAAPGPAAPPISILKPLRGAEAHAYECLASFCRQEYPEYELVFGVMAADDPAIAVVRRLERDFPAVPVRLVVSAERLGSNLKVSNLANMLPAARFETLLISDSDMRVTPGYLRQVAAALAAPGVGLVTCPYRGADLRSPAAALEALGIATDFLPGVLVVARLGRPDFAFGSTIALSRTLLAETGGLGAIADYLADDFQLGNRVAATGRRVALAPYVVESVLGAERFRPMVARRLRWARTVRACRPAGHAASVVTQSTVFALCFLAASGFRPLGWGVLALQQAVRAGTAYQVAVRDLGNRELRRWFWLLPASDLLNFGLWAGSWLGRHVLWRGTRFRLDRGGKVRAIPDPPRLPSCGQSARRTD
jgi:ceramide glucosyltransferase